MSDWVPEVGDRVKKIALAPEGYDSGRWPVGSTGIVANVPARPYKSGMRDYEWIFDVFFDCDSVHKASYANQHIGGVIVFDGQPDANIWENDLVLEKP